MQRLSIWDKIGMILERSRWIALSRGYAGVWECEIRLYRDSGGNDAYNALRPLGSSRGAGYRVRIIDVPDPDDQISSFIQVEAFNDCPLEAASLAFRAAYPGKALPWEVDNVNV